MPTDKERLDFMDKNPRMIWHRFVPYFMGWGHGYMDEDSGGFSNIREAIDAAIRASRKPRRQGGR